MTGTLKFHTDRPLLGPEFRIKSQKEFTSMTAHKANLVWLRVHCCYFSCPSNSSLEQLTASL